MDRRESFQVEPVEASLSWFAAVGRELVLGCVFRRNAYRAGSGDDVETTAMVAGRRIRNHVELVGQATVRITPKDNPARG